MNKLKHLAIIVDGNRRWAKERGLSTSQGHYEGSKNIEKIIKHLSKSNDIKILSLFVFSTENFNRTQEEVEYLMQLFQSWFKYIKKISNKYDIKIVFSGLDEPLDDNIIKEKQELTEKTKNNKGLIVNFCLNYGGRQEIINATKRIVKEKIKVENITENLFSKYMFQDLGDIDLLIRTSGEQRISNFMLWQLSYAELIFTKTYFPDLTTEELDSMIEEFYNRNRRFGKN